MLNNQTGLPGVGNTVFATPRDIYYSHPNFPQFIPLPIALSGAKCYNAANDPYPFIMWAGMPIGIITATGLWANSILGTTSGAYTSGGTSLTVTAAQAKGIVQRIGSSGTFFTSGPPTAAGTNAVTATTFSAVNTTSGVITVSSLGVDKVAGSIIQPNDGSQTIRTILADLYGVKLTDWTNINVVNAFVQGGAYSGGFINTAMLVDYPTDTSIQAYIKSSIKSYVGNVMFSDDFGF